MEFNKSITLRVKVKLLNEKSHLKEFPVRTTNIYGSSDIPVSPTFQFLFKKKQSKMAIV
jgi:hypothetical protein